MLENRVIKFNVFDKIYNKILSHEEIKNKKLIELLNNKKYDVLEYTGESDKNGIDIYEGYIYEVYGPYMKGLCVVVKNGSGFSFKAIGKNILISVSMMHEYAILTGNVYENKELLKTKER